MNIKTLLNTQFEELSTSLAKQKISDDTKTKQLVRVEIEKSLGKENFINGIYKGGLNKEQLTKYVEEIFGTKNFQNGKFKGGKEVVLEVINELFGQANFKDGKYQGGWNENQDTANIQKIFKSENFTNNEYTGGWNKAQDLQNLKQSLTEGEAKINELASKDYDETNKRSKSPNTIKKLAGLYKLTNAEIDYKKELNSEGKLVWTLRMKTPINA